MTTGLCTWVLAVALTIAASVQGDGIRSPTAAELLDKYTQALDSLVSIVIKAEITSEHEGAFAKDWVDPSVRGVRYKGKDLRRVEYRTDGWRFHRREYTWGDINPAQVSLPEDRPNYICMNWDGRQYYQHTRAINTPDLRGSINIISESSPDKYKLWPRNAPVAYLMGYNMESDERMDSILRRAKGISIRPKTENVNGSDCYVIDARTDIHQAFLILACIKICWNHLAHSSFC